MPKVDIKNIIKGLKKNELTELISVSQEVGVGVKTSFYMRNRILDVINL